MNRAFVAVMIAASFTAPRALAHERSASRSVWTVSGDRVRVALTLAERDVAAGMLGVDVARAGASAIREVLVGQLRASAAGKRCAPDRSTFRTLAASEGSISWEWIVVCPRQVSSLLIESHLFEHEAPHHMHVVRVQGSGGSVDRILSGAQRTTMVRVGRSEAVSFGRALRLGIEHLLTGADHLIFLLMLVVASLNPRALVIAITGFTLGHSITLALGALGWVQPNTALVEALIGVSIVVVAVERVWLPPLAAHASRLRATLAAVFGLVHGLGFAEALSERPLAPTQLLPTLLGFNTGVEVAQLVIATVAWTALSIVRGRNVVAASWIVDLAAAVACGAGVYWTITRIA